MALRLHILRKHDILTPVGKQICDTKEKERFSHPLMKAGKFIRKYNHIWTLLYIVFYMPWFMWLEKTVTTDFHLVSMPIDYKIPFCEYFIIPYGIWFVYIAVSCFFMYFKGTDEEYRRFAWSLIIGMSTCMIICLIYPNADSGIRSR